MSETSERQGSGAASAAILRRPGESRIPDGSGSATPVAAPASDYTLRALRMAALALLGLYTLALAVFSHRGFPTGLTTGLSFPYLSDQPVGEDGYYMLLAAWNLAAGQGLTGNFGEPVTGIQPLMTLVLGAVAAVVRWLGGDKFDFARAMILFGGANLAVFGLIVAALVRGLVDDHADRELAATVALIVATLSFYLFRTFTYGLETGLYLTLIAAAMLVAVRVYKGGGQGPAAALGMGLLIGLCGLARIDFGAVAAVVYLALLAARRVSFGSAVLAGVVALAVVSPWFVWVKWVSGSFMPTSGPAQAELVTLGNAAGRAETMLLSVAQNLMPWTSAVGRPLALMGGIAGLALVWFLAGTPNPLRLAWRAGVTRVFMAWSLGFALLPFVYFAFFWAAHFYPRYTAPLALVGIALMALVAAATPAHRRILAGALVLAAAAIGNGIFAYQTHHRGGISDGHAVAAGYVAARLPADKRVGAFQSGVVGFYNENVINLDGKVNAEALAALRDKKVEAYLDRAGIDYMVEWEGVVLGLTGDAVPSGRWERCAEPVGNLHTVCFQRKGIR